MCFCIFTLSMKITLVGAGKLGTQLYEKLVCVKEIQIVQWYIRSSKKNKTNEGITITNDAKKLKKTDLYIIAVSDNAIEKVSNILPENSFVVHTSGCISINKIKQSRRGVFYPIQTFSKGRNIDFSTISIGLESKRKNDYLTLEKLVDHFGANCININSDQRKQLHLAAVLVNNFPNYLYAEAERLCIEQGLSFELLKPLLFETVSKLNQLRPSDAQTGPAVRNDKKTIKQHLRLLNKSRLKTIYKLLTKEIQKKNGKQL